MSLLNFGGFESGDAVEGTSSAGTPNFQTSIKNTGDYAMELDGPTGEIWWTRGLASSGLPADLGRTAATYYTFWARITTLPGSTQTIFLVRAASAGAVVAQVNLTAGGVVTGGGATTSATVATLSVDGLFHKFELMVLSNGTSSLAVDGGASQTFTAANETQNVIMFTMLSSGVIVIDDWFIDDAGFTTATGVIRMDVSGDGTDTGWTGTSADVDEIPHDSGSTFINSTSTSAAETVALESAASAGVAGPLHIKQGAVMAEASSTTTLAGLRLRSGANTSDTTPVDVGNTSYVLFARVFLTNPDGSVAWTNSALDALEAGVLKGNDNSDVRCTSIWVMVAQTGNTPPEITVAPTVDYVLSGAWAESTPATVNFTAVDAEQDGANELSYEIRTATGGGGDLVESGTFTSGVAEDVDIDYDNAELAAGDNTLYLLIDDGFETDEASFVLRVTSPVEQDVTLQYRVGGTASQSASLQWRVGGVTQKALTAEWLVYPSALRIEYALTGQLRGVVRPTFRFEQRTRAGLYVADVSSIVTAAWIEHNENRAVKRTAGFTIVPALDDTIDLDPVADHVMPIMRVLVDGNWEEDIPLGLFALTVPEERDVHTHSEWAVGGSDLSIHLVEDYIDAPYVVAAGANPISGANGVEDLLTAAGVTHAIPPTSATLTVAYVPAVGTPKLEVVNKLLDAASMYNLSFDSNGVARSRIQADLSARTPDATYGDGTWIVDPILKKREVTRFANRIIVINTDPENPFSVTVENNDPLSPISIPNLGVTRTKKVALNTLPDAAAAEAWGARYLETEAGLYEARSIQTFPDPRRQFNEVVALEVADETENWFVQNWRLELREGVPMTYELGRADRVASEVA